jgi:hypothetical protein
MTRVVVRPQVNRVRVLGAFDPNYGSFEFRGSDQTWTETSPIPLNWTNFAKHIEIGEGGAISFREKGKYNIQFSAQLIKLTGGTHAAEIWLQQNGEAVAHSNTTVTISGSSNTALVTAWNWFVDVEANDYVQLYWWVDAINTIKIDSRPATSGRPEIPGVILTVNQVG